MIDIIKYTFKYVLVNKSAGVLCDGNKYNSLVPLLRSKFKTLSKSSRFSLVHRLDKYVTGGLIVSRDDKFTRRLNKAFRYTDSNYKVTRRYVGLLPLNIGPFKEQIEGRIDEIGSIKQIEERILEVNSKIKEEDNNEKSLETKDGDISDYPSGLYFKDASLETKDGDISDYPSGLYFKDASLSTGFITFPVELLEKDYKGKKTQRSVLEQSALTKFKILHDHKYFPTKELVRKYPGLFESKVIYPVIFELGTGRKNQIRDHVRQAFGVPLLNDDNFEKFKWVLDNELSISPNSQVFKNNQIGLHSTYMVITASGEIKESVIFPVYADLDRELWTGMVDREGYFNKEVEREVQQM